jgi:hypothetical protein
MKQLIHIKIHLQPIIFNYISLKNVMKSIFLIFTPNVPITYVPVLQHDSAKSMHGLKYIRCLLTHEG